MKYPVTFLILLALFLVSCGAQPLDAEAQQNLRPYTQIAENTYTFFDPRFGVTCYVVNEYSGSDGSAISCVQTGFEEVE